MPIDLGNVMALVIYRVKHKKMVNIIILVYDRKNQNGGGEGINWIFNLPKAIIFHFSNFLYGDCC